MFTPARPVRVIAVFGNVTFAGESFPGGGERAACGGRVGAVEKADGVAAAWSRVAGGQGAAGPVVKSAVISSRPCGPNIVSRLWAESVAAASLRGKRASS